MRVFAEARRRLAVLFRPGRFDRELEEELQNHVAMQTEEFREQGLDPQAARYAAMRKLGNPALLLETGRETWGWRWLEDWLRDIQFAMRMARRTPLFISLAILTLALGIGLNAAIFSLLYDATMARLPVNHPEQLIQLTWTQRSQTGTTFNWPDYRPLLKPEPALPGLFAALGWDANLRSGEVTGRVRAQAVSGAYYPSLGVPAHAGRPLGPEDDRVEAAPAAVLSYACWHRRFGLDPGVLGHTVSLDGAAVTIVGVMPAYFKGMNRLSQPDITVALETAHLPTGKSHYVAYFARLGDGSSADAARTQVQARYAGLLATELKAVPWMQDIRLGVASAAAGDIDAASDLEISLGVLGPCAGVVLLICCTNLACLLLARAGSRSREIATRLSMGASRLRVVRQLLTESVALAVAGGGAGLLVAWWSRSLLTARLLPASSETIPFRLHPPLLAFTAAISVASALLFGLAPALRSTRGAVGSHLRGEAPFGALKFGRMGRGFLTFQVAPSLALLLIATMFVRTLRKLESVDTGFDRDRLVVMTVDPRDSRFREQRVAGLLDEIMDRAAAVPGIRGAAFAQMALFGGSALKNVWMQGGPEDSLMVAYNLVGPRFFATAGVPVLLGRDFSLRDRDGAPLVAMVNETFVHRCCAGRNPVGLHFGDQGMASAGKYQIIGVIKDAKYRDLRHATQPAVFEPLWQHLEDPPFVLHLRTDGDPIETAGRVRQTIKGIDPNVTVYNMQTLAESVSASLSSERTFSMLTACFGMLALALCCIGLYGVSACSVTRRTREIGVRIALGADRSAVLLTILRDTLVLTAIGVALGAPLALGCAKALQSVWFGMSAFDPVSIAFAAGVLAAMAMIACIMPAFRATRIDPVGALRYE
jgi:predicted permease